MSQVPSDLVSGRQKIFTESVRVIICILYQETRSDFGGHVMDFVIKEGVVELGAVDQLDQRFPITRDLGSLFA